MLAAGFALLVLPYVFYVSGRTGRLTVIESIGYFSLKRFIVVSPVDPSINLLAIMHDPSGPPTTGEVLRFLGRDFAASPSAFILRRLDFVRLLVKPGGAAFIASNFAPTHASARLLTAAVHLALDLPFVLALVLAPFGLVLARQRRTGLFIALWPPIYLGLVALMLWAGTRYRAPAEPVLLTLACVVAAGGWRHPGRGALAAAAVATVAMLMLVGISAPSIVSARMNYGITATPEPGEDVAFTGEMGVYYQMRQNTLAVTVRNDAGAAMPVDVRVDGKTADAFVLNGEATRRYTFETPRRVFLEIRGAGRMTARLE
jgi:hypothetical protein